MKSDSSSDGNGGGNTRDWEDSSSDEEVPAFWEVRKRWGGNGIKESLCQVVPKERPGQMRKVARGKWKPLGCKMGCGCAGNTGGGVATRTPETREVCLIEEEGDLSI